MLYSLSSPLFRQYLSVVKKSNKQLQTGGAVSNSKAVSERAQVYPSSTGI
ncbi:Lysine methyltransferase [Cryptosporidium tyzzeri]|uniref:Uncharacterized protein n=2 Tax=Cryptosporidium TaxID=5806 RepID=A0A0S4TJX2_CRYHO|nr:Uncharacterized protein GY17_00002412 [Cryptosporidium hominis]QOY40853.1 hypothetical protein CPATCC_0011210 [Cryptosporidium parvum]TRY50334.1 Lysine methyltransferase [Cryptosporidium tyzzeri]WRK33710.1 hypothetical protein cpbgf_7005255 [Cryptosporidium parvum]CUV07516.1 unnamed protein product [Cryptosporidium hominis]|eukprot:QOY40853.1 hypothetical protein CPATCC_003758 [Cryptosporidium parvum]